MRKNHLGQFMKWINRSNMQTILILMFGTILFASCKSSFPLVIDSSKALDHNYKAYLVTNAGDTLKGESLTVKNENKFFKATTYSIDGSKEYKSKEIKGYQNSQGRYFKVDGQLTEALTGPRILTFITWRTETEYNANTHSSTTRQVPIHHFYNPTSNEWAIESLKSIGTISRWVEDNSDASD